MAALVLPLRRWDQLFWYTLLTWSALGLVMFLVVRLNSIGENTFMLMVSAVIALATVLHVASLALTGGPANAEVDSSVENVVAALGAVAIALSLLAFGLQSWPIGSAGSIAWGLAALTAVVAVLIVVGAGIILCGHRINRQINRLVTPPRGPGPLGWRLMGSRPERSQHSADVLGQIGYAFVTFLYRTGQGLEVAIRGLTQLLRLFLHAIVVTLCWFVNVLHEWWVRFRRRLVAAVLEAFAIAIAAVVVGARSLIHTLRVISLPLILMATATVLADRWRAWALEYTVEGSATALGMQVMYAALALAALTATWILLAGQPLRASLTSLSRTTSIAGANGLILLAAGGWTLGLLGSALDGVIRVGWLTIIATGVLVFAAIWSRIRRTRAVPA